MKLSMYCARLGQWIHPTVTGDSLPPCSNFSFTSIGDNKAVLFGGVQGTMRSNDVFVAKFTKDSVVSSQLFLCVPASHYHIVTMIIAINL